MRNKRPVLVRAVVAPNRRFNIEIGGRGGPRDTWETGLGVYFAHTGIQFRLLNNFAFIPPASLPSIRFGPVATVNPTRCPFASAHTHSSMPRHLDATELDDLFQMHRRGASSVLSASWVLASFAMCCGQRLLQRYGWN